MDKPFAVEKMKAALLAIQDRATEPQMAMLKAHYECRILSTGRLAAAGGYGDGDNYTAGNLQYGGLCKKIAAELGYEQGDRISVIASVHPELDDKGKFQWRMDDAVATALEELGWVTRTAGD